MTGGWVSGGETDSTETLVEGGSAWTTQPPLWTGVGDARMVTYNNIPYMFGGNTGPPVAGRVEHSHWSGGSRSCSHWSRAL